MAGAEISIGEFVSITGDILIAELNGTDVYRACGILGTRPPFRNTSEHLLLSEEDREDAIDLALVASNACDIAIMVGEHDPAIQEVIFSSTGALAVKYARGDYPEDTFYDFIDGLNGGQKSTVCLAHRSIV